MPKKKKISNAGRPPKLTKTFLSVAKEVIEDGRNSVILTDEELLSMINEKLPTKLRIGKTAWTEWKSGKTPMHASEEAKNFRLLLKRALIRQKKDLFEKLIGDDKAWQRFAWIIERKFDEWNIKHKTDLTSKDEPITGFNFLPPAPQEKK